MMEPLASRHTHPAVQGTSSGISRRGRGVNQQRAKRKGVSQWRLRRQRIIWK